VSAQQTTAVSAVVSERRAWPGRLSGALEENGTLVMVVGAFGIVMLAALRQGLVVDGWMALVSGREIAQHGLPVHDTLATMTHGHRWVDQQWLAQLLLYWLWIAGGVKLALLVHATLGIGALAGAAALARRLGGSARTTTWVCLPVLVAYYPESSVLRPQTFAYPLFVAALWLLATDARAPSKRVFLTLPLLILWANLHGSVLIGAALVSLAGLASLAQHVRRPSARGLVLVVAPWLCVLASPYALHLPSYYEKILVGGNFSHFVSEWAPTTLTASTAPVYLLVLAGLWLLGRNGGRISTFEKLAFLATSVLAFQAVRNAAWLGLTALAILPTLIDGLRRPVVEPRRLNRLLATVVLAGLAVAFAGVATNKPGWFTADFPSDAAEAAATAAGSGGAVFAMSPYADWLLWSQPQLRGRVAFDARFELLTSRQVASIGAFQSRVGDWRRAVRGYRVVVLDRRDDGKLQKALVESGAMKMVQTNRDVVVLRRVD
jgi:hypothetical protein